VNAAAASPGNLLAGLRAPRRLLPVEVERAMTARQREILDALELLVVQDGFADLTMAQLAARVNCSLRTLYGLAPRKDALLLTVGDRRLHRIGRKAMAAIEPDMDALAAVRAYLMAATTAVGATTEGFARRFAAVPGANRLIREHGDYVVAVTRRLLDRAVDEGAIARLDTGALALVLGGLGAFFSRPEIIPRIQASPKATADAIMDLVLGGLERRANADRIPSPPPVGPARTEVTSCPTPRRSPRATSSTGRS
jgi:AcrR family transcriptional regulator